MRLSTILAALATVAAATLPVTASAQVVTVNATAPADYITSFNTITDALAYVASDPTSPDVVRVTDSATYEEVINIYSPVVLEGVEGERPTMALLANFNGTPMPGEAIGHGGIWINLPDTLSTGTVVLRNFNILPSLTETTVDRRLRTAIENGNNNLYLEIDNCNITANEHGAPLSTDPYTSRIYAVFPGSTGTPEPYDPSIVMFGGHGIVLGRSYTGYVEGDGVELLLKDSLITHLKNDYHEVEPEKFPTGIVMHAPWAFDPATWDQSITRITRIEGESGISFCDVSVSASGDLNVEGTAETPVVFRSSASWTVRFDGPAFNYRNLNNVTIADMSNGGILDRGFGPIRWTMNNCRMFMALNSLIRVEIGKDGDNIVHPASGQITINDSTLVGGRFHATAGRSAHTIRLEVDTQCDIHFENSIIGGKKNQNIGVNVISLAGYNNATANGSSIITEGPYALRIGAPFSRGPNATIPANAEDQYGVDPQFLVVDTNGGPNYPADPGFLDVQSELYADMNASGGPLGGGADYVGGVSASVSDWSVY